MIGELDVQGVFLSSVLITSLVAFAAAFALRRVLRLIGVYRFVWHPALFDTALFVILWASVIALPLPNFS